MTTRTLAIRIAPLSGESLESWTDAYASRLQVPRRVFRHNNYGLRTRWGRILMPEDLDTFQPLADASGIEIEDVLAMTEYAFPTVHGAATTFARNSADDRRWTLRTLLRIRPQTQFCPRCVADSGGRWSLMRRSRWQFVCPEHRCLLLETCQGCGEIPTLRRMATDIPALLQCGSHPHDHPAESACTFPLTDCITTELAPDDPVLRAQHTVNKALHTVMNTPRHVVTSDSPQSVLDAIAFIADSALLAARLRKDADWSAVADQTSALRSEHSTQPPSDATHRRVLDAVASGTAINILAADDDTAVDSLRQLLPGFGEPLTRVANYRKTARTNTGGRLESLFCTASRTSAIDTLRQTWHRQQPSPSALAAQLAAVSCIPQRMWPTWSIRLLWPGISEDYGRTGLSLATAVAITGQTVADCADLLDITDDPHQLTVLWHQAGSSRLPPAVMSAVIRLAAHLVDQPGPIDYARRRRLDYTDLLTENDWQQIVLDNRLDGYRGKRNYALAREFLYQRITLNHTTRGVTDDHPPADIPRLRRMLGPRTLAALDTHASMFLHRHGIDEPLRAEPPVGIIADLEVPGPPVPLPRNEITRLLCDDHRSVSGAAHHLGIAPVALRVYLTDQPIPHSAASPRTPQQSAEPPRTADTPDVQSVPRPVRSSATVRASSRVTPEELYEAYVVEHRTVHHVGLQFGLSDSRVRTLLRENGITIRGHKTISVDTAQIVDLYVTQHLPTTEIARRLGVSRSTISSRLQEAGVRLRAGGTSQGTVVVPLPVDDITHLYIEEQMTIQELSARYGVCTGTISRRLKQQGVVVHHGPRRSPTTDRVGRRAPRDVKPTVQVPAETLRSLYVDQQLSARKIATQFNITATEVEKLMRDNGIAQRVRSPGAGRTREISTDELRERYIDRHQSLAEMAVALDAAVSTIRKRLHAAGIRTRGHRRNIPPIPGDLLRARYSDDGKPVADIADEFQVSKSHIYECLHREGIPLRRPPKPSR